MDRYHFRSIAPQHLIAPLPILIRVKNITTNTSLGRESHDSAAAAPHGGLSEIPQRQEDSQGEQEHDRADAHQ